MNYPITRRVRELATEVSRRLDATARARPDARLTISFVEHSAVHYVNLGGITAAELAAALNHGPRRPWERCA